MEINTCLNCTREGVQRDSFKPWERECLMHSLEEDLFELNLYMAACGSFLDCGDKLLIESWLHNKENLKEACVGLKFNEIELNFKTVETLLTLLLDDCYSSLADALEIAIALEESSVR